MHDDMPYLTMRHGGLTVTVAPSAERWIATEVAFTVQGLPPVYFDVWNDGGWVVFETGQYPMGTSQVGVPFFDY